MTSRDGRDVADQARYMLQGQENSGYIDYGHRLKAETFVLYFDRRKRFTWHSCELAKNMALRWLRVCSIKGCRIFWGYIRAR